MCGKASREYISTNSQSRRCSIAMISWTSWNRVMRRRILLKQNLMRHQVALIQSSGSISRAALLMEATLKSSCHSWTWWTWQAVRASARLKPTEFVWEKVQISIGVCLLCLMWLISWVRQATPKLLLIIVTARWPAFCNPLLVVIPKQPSSVLWPKLCWTIKRPLTLCILDKKQRM